MLFLTKLLLQGEDILFRHQINYFYAEDSSSKCGYISFNFTSLSSEQALQCCCPVKTCLIYQCLVENQ